jgi:hypothetical protein
MIKEYFKYETTDYKNIEDAQKNAGHIALGIVLAGQTVIRAKTGDDFIFQKLYVFMQAMLRMDLHLVLSQTTCHK